MIPLPMCKEKLIGRNFGTNFHENSYIAEKSSYLINKKKKKNNEIRYISTSFSKENEKKLA